MRNALKNFGLTLAITALAVSGVGCSRQSSTASSDDGGSEAQSGVTVRKLPSSQEFSSGKNKGMMGSENSILSYADDSSSFDEFVSDSGNHPGASELLAATGLLTLPNRASAVYDSRSCTVTHLGNNKALTAGHCLPPAGQDCSGYQVAWLGSGRSVGTATSCVQVLFNGFHLAEGNADRSDVGIFTVASGATSSYDPRNYAARTLSADARLWLVGFLRGGGVAFSEDSQCTLVVSRDSSLVKHYCDTESSMSGALIMLGRSHAVVGMHSRDSGQGDNVGVSISRLVSLLQRFL